MKNYFLINSDQKEAFLNGYKNSTYDKLLRKIDNFEYKKNKTVLEMDINYIKQFLTEQKKMTTINSYASVWSKYVKFLSNQDMNNIGYISIKQITSAFKYDCCNKEMLENMYITEKEYYQILESKEGNIQDKVLIILLWNQIMGKEYSEIINIKKDDINFDENYIKIINRKVYFKPIEMDIIRMAFTEKEHKIYDNYGNLVSINYYLDGDYLIKASIGKRNFNNTNNQANRQTIQNNFSNYLNNVLKRPIEGKSIYNSRIFYDMLKENKKKMRYTEIENYLKKHNNPIYKSQLLLIQDIMIRKIKNEEKLFVFKDELISNSNVEDSHFEITAKNTFIFDVDDSVNNDNENQFIYKVYEGSEGKLKYYLGKHYERNKKLRDIAVKIHGYNCYVCDFNFLSKYGKYGEGYIEVHHKTPLYRTGKIVVNPELDLIVVCSNCHRIIHRYRDIVIDGDEIKKLIKE